MVFSLYFELCNLSGKVRGYLKHLSGAGRLLDLLVFAGRASMKYPRLKVSTRQIMARCFDFRLHQEFITGP